MVLDLFSGELPPAGAETADRDEAPPFFPGHLTAFPRLQALSVKKCSSRAAGFVIRFASKGSRFFAIVRPGFRPALYILGVERQRQRVRGFEAVLLDCPKMEPRAEHFEPCEVNGIRDAVYFAAEQRQTRFDAIRGQLLLPGFRQRLVAKSLPQLKRFFPYRFQVSGIFVSRFFISAFFVPINFSDLL